MNHKDHSKKIKTVEKQTIVVFVGDDIESKEVCKWIKKNLESSYNVRYCPASGDFVPSVGFEGDYAFFGRNLWNFLSDLKRYSRKIH